MFSELLQIFFKILKKLRDVFWHLFW
jgi:hypothetical protein